jgi:hypothetical protein
MRSKLDPREGGLALNALLAAEPDAALWLQITKLRTIAIAKGEVPPAYYKIVPLEPPTCFRNLGFNERKRAEKAAAAAKSESSS